MRPDARRARPAAVRQRLAAGVLLVAGVLPSSVAWARTLVACAEAPGGAECAFAGDDAVQRAVDAAADGDRVLLRSGRFRGDGYRDVAFEDLIVRGRVVVAGKRLVIEGEPGTVLDLGSGVPASGIVVHRGSLVLRGVDLVDARPADADDDIYDGHGVFVVDADATLEDVTLRRIGKMALSIRGASVVRANGVRMLDGHVGVWIEEAAQLELADCVVARNDSAAVAAYAQARVTVSACTLEANEDDGLYAAEQAVVEAAGVLFVRNRPFAARAVDAARISVTGSAFCANVADRNDAPAGAVEVASSRSFPGYCSAHDERQPNSPGASCSQ